MNNIDKWCAEQCGIEIFDGGGIPQWKPYPRAMLMPFTIEDARCREIVRERFEIWTEKDHDVFKSGTGGYNDRIIGEGKTIAEAEIACITAIWEKDND